MSPETAEQSSPGRRSNGDPALSIVVPIYNEAGSVESLVELLDSAAKAAAVSCEVILIDDGSKDATAERLKELCARYPDLVAVVLTKNFGQHAALSAGFDFSRGQRVMITDSDEAIRPDELLMMIAAMEGDIKIVNGVLRVRNQSLPRKIVSRMVKAYLARLFRTTLTTWIASQVLMDREVVDTVRRLPERRRNIHGLLSWTGYRTRTVEIEHVDALQRESRYRFSALVRSFLEVLTAFAFRPLMFPFVYTGILLGTATLLMALFLLVGADFRATRVSQATMVVIILLSGVLLTFVGVLGAYIGRINIQTQLRPIYLVRKIMGQNAPDGPRP